MLIYTIIIIFLLCCVCQYDNKGKSGIFAYIFIWIFLILLIGLQNKMGGDNLSYEVYFKESPTLEQLTRDDFIIGSRQQPLWILFIGFVKYISNSYTSFHIIHSILLNSIVAVFFFKTSRRKFLTTLLFFVTFDFFYFNIEIQRESLAIAVFCLSYYKLQKRQYLHYYLLVLIAFLFHASATFLFLIPLIWWFYRRGYYKLLSIIIVLFVMSLSFIQESLIGTGYEVIRNLNQQRSHYQDIEANITHTLIASVFGCIPFFIFISLKKYSQCKSQFFIFCTLMYCLFNIANVYTNFTYRFCNYMMPFVFVYLSSFVNVPKIYKKYVILAYMMLVVSYIYRYTGPATFLGSNANLYEMYIPYRSVLFN